MNYLLVEVKEGFKVKLYRKNEIKVAYTVYVKTYLEALHIINAISLGGETVNLTIGAENISLKH